MVSPASAQSTVTYNMQLGNFNSQQTQNNNNPPYAGNFNNNSSEIGQYANHGSFGNTPGAAAFENFTTSGVGSSGTQRGLQIGDSFTITNFTGSNPSAGGEIAIAFQTSTGSSSFSSVYNNVAAKFSLYDSGGYQAIGASSNISSLGSNTDTTLTLTVTSSNTFNATISDAGASVTYYDLQMGNSPSASTRIQSFALYTFGDNNSNSYWKNGALTSTGAVTLGAGNGTSTISGAITDGLQAGSATAVQSNAVTKSGTGTITLNASNTYTGQTTVNGGTLTLDSAGATTAVLANTSGIVLNTGGTLLLANSGSTASANRINDAATVTLSGGTLNLGGLSEGAAGTSGVGALTLMATSKLDFGTTGTSNLIQFAGVGTHTTGAMLQITDWEGTAGSANGTDRLLFAGSSTAFTLAYLPTDVSFNGVPGYGIQSFSGYYEVYGLVAVPEPATWAAGALCAGLAFGTLRRRSLGGILAA